MKKFLLFLFTVLTGCHISAQSINPFTIWQQVTQRGDVTFTGNSMLTCNGGATCTTAQAAVSPTGSGSGNNYSNNGFTMVYTNIADATDAVARFSRSNANLTLGSTGGCGVIYAELCWGGNITNAVTNYAKRDSVYFRTPVGGYVGLKADIKTDVTTATPFPGYYCYKDVTTLVRQGGAGTYWLADEVVQNGATNLCGGWMLVVIYYDPALPLRNLTIFRGLSSISSGNPQNIPISGFFTPPTPAAVNIKLGVYSFEGDRGTTGDSLKFNGNPTFGFLSVTDTKHAADNAFNSTINNNTAEITRNPAFPNTLGVDGNIFVPNNTAYNYLPNSASSATLRMTSSGDVYAPFMISTAIDVFEPDIQVTKTGTDLNGGLVELGDTLLFSLKVVNKGNDPADSLVLVDSLYGAMNFVPGSLRILTGPNSGVKTDASNDDQAEFNNTIKYAKFRLGNGANTIRGGKMGITAATDSVTTLEFKVRVTTDCQIFHCSPNIVNKAYVTFYGQTSGAQRSTASSPSGFDAFGCPIQGATTLLVHVPPCTPTPDTSVTACTPYNLSNILPNRAGYSNFYNSTWTSVTQAAATGTYYGLKQLYPGCSDTIVINFNGPCVLPIILADFNATYKNNLVQLNWVTRQEINNKAFRIERSIDGTNFETIATVAGAINSQVTKTYTYDDYQFPHVSRIFYRLVQIDIDGGKQSSTIKWVYLKDFNQKNLEIYSIAPQPVSNMANLSIITPAAGNYTFTLINSLGQVIESRQMNLDKGYNNKTYDCTNIAAGFYFLEVKDKLSGEKDIHKLIVQ